MRERIPILAASILLLSTAAVGARQPSDPVAATPPSNSPASSPLAPHGGFIENRGQWDSPARFAIPGSEAAFAVDGDGLALWILEATPEGRSAGAGAPEESARSGVHLRLDWLGASDGRRLEGLDRLPGIRNYLLGRDRTKWATHVPAFARVASRGLYDGIDLVLRTDERGRVAYDVILAPGANPSVIELAVRGAEGLSIRPDGSLAIATALGEVVQTPPRTWQTSADGNRCAVASRFALRSSDTFGFEMPEPLDPGLALVIDPSIDFWTYIGGTSGDRATAVCVGSGDEPIIGGFTLARDVLIPYPTTPGTFLDTLPLAGALGVVTRFAQSGDSLVYSTFIGAAGTIFDSTGVYFAEIHPVSQEVFIAGRTDHADFPTTPGAFDSTFDPPTPPYNYDDLFAARLTPDGSDLIYSTFLGTNDLDQLAGIVLHDDFRLTLAGHTESSSWPTTPGSLVPVDPSGDRTGFVTQFSPDGTALVFSTYIGGSVAEHLDSIAVASDGSFYLGGATGSPDFPVSPLAYDSVLGATSKSYVLRLDPTGTTVVASTFVSTWSSVAVSIAVDAQDRPLVIGRSSSTTIPTTSDAYSQTPLGESDITILRFDPLLQQLEYGTYLGGALGSDRGDRAIVAPSGALLIAGNSQSADFPMTTDAIDSTYAGPYPYPDALFVMFDSHQPGSSGLLYSSFFGGSASDQWADLAVDSQGRILLAGRADSINLPVTPGAIQSALFGASDAHLLRLRLVEAEFRRGDINADGAMNIADAVALLGSLFSGGSPPACHDAADANDDGAVDVADAVIVLGALFLPGSPQPPAPGALVCGIDPTSDTLGCAGASGCP